MFKELVPVSGTQKEKTKGPKKKTPLSSFFFGGEGKKQETSTATSTAQLSQSPYLWPVARFEETFVEETAAGFLV